VLEHHRERLETASAISPGVVSARGYYSVETHDELKGLGFPRDVRRHLPSLMIPLYAVRPREPGEPLEPTGLLLRPDVIYQFKDGRTAKYLSPSGQGNVLDVHPLARDWLLDATVPLVVTEGVIKADAAVSVGLAAIGLGGVDGGWRDGAPLPAWELIPLKGRSTLIAFDSDVTVKPSVRGALQRLIGYLRRRGAQVEIVVLPAGPHGAKTGLDDFLAAHRGSKYPIGLLLEHAVAPDEVTEGEVAPPQLPVDVSGADVLDGLCTMLSNYIRFRSPEQAWAVALWIAATHFVVVFEIVPYLAISSATLRSGKTHLLDLVRWTCARGRRMSAGSDAAIFRTLNAEPPPCLMFDEVDNYIGEHTERAFLIGVLNEGFERDGVVARVEDVGGGAREVVDYRVFGMKCFTGIGTLLPATTMDRCVRVKLERRLRTERVAKWRARRVREQADGVRDLLAGWAAAAADTVAEAYDRDLEFTIGTNERAEDVWEALLAVAEAAGREWPRRARAAAVALTPADDDSSEHAVLLLADIRRVFTEAESPQAMKSGDLVTRLNALEEAPWGGLRDGKGLSTHRLARELAAFDLVPERDQLDGQTVRGWWRRSLEPVFARYLPNLDDDNETSKDAEPATAGSQSVAASESDGFPHNQADSSSDTSNPRNDPQRQSVRVEAPANQEVPDTPTVSDDETVETRNQASGTVVEERLPTAFNALSQTIEIGAGPPLMLHRLPPDTPAAREAFNKFLSRAHDRGALLALDCETTGTDPYEPGFAVRIWSVSDGQEAWALDARDDRNLGLLAATLDGWPHGLAVHNATFDIPVAARTLPVDAGALTGRAAASRLVDTMILARLAHPDARRVALKQIAVVELGPGAAVAEERLKTTFKHMGGRAATKWTTIDAANPAYWGYAAADAALTARLHERLRADVDDDLLAREMRIALICLRAGLRGWAVDTDAAAQLEHDLAAEQERLERALRRNGITSVTTKAGRTAIETALRREGHTLPRMSLAKEILEPLALSGSGVARDVLALRTVSKFLAVYVPMFTGAATGDGRLHAFPLTCATVTGRMSLPGVPLQTAPKGELELAGENGTFTAAIRSALVANEKNVIASVDFTTMELRIAAALSDDARLRAVVEAGDAHAAVAKRLFNTNAPSAKQRAVAKTINFGVLYGMGGEGVARRLRIDDDTAREFVSRWWESFPAVRALRERLAGEERRSLWGRRLPHQDVPKHIALNHVVQGYGRDVFCAGLLALENAGLDEHLLLPLHDEYVLSVPAGDAHEIAAEIAGCVRSRLGDLELPVETNIGGRSWASVGAGAP
jgi:DNA polymerase-1